MGIMEENLRKLAEGKKLDQAIIIWGVCEPSRKIIAWLRENGYADRILFLADNFKSAFYREFDGVPVFGADRLKTLDKSAVTALLAFSSDSVQRQLEAYGINEVYQLLHLERGPLLKKCVLPYRFDNRSKGRRYLRYVLAGYEPTLWDSTLARISAYQSTDFDYCLVSSGKYDATLDRLAAKNQWSYLCTEKNQVCFIQNLVIDLHPAAEYIIKMDEDIFIGRKFFDRMVSEYHKIEQYGEYRIGFAVPVIPLNCCGYVSYLKLIGKMAAYEEQFGRAYKSRFSAIYTEGAAKFLWDTMDNFDEMAERFLQNSENPILDCYFNIGCIMYSRDRWMMMGRWPENLEESGMGRDEAYIYEDNVRNDLSIYEIQGVLAGHLAFGAQKEQMLGYYREHPEKFQLPNKNQARL